MSARPTRPPGTGSRSTTVTRRPRPARCSAADNPASPAPTTTTWSARPPMALITFAVPAFRLSCGPDRADCGHARQGGAERLFDVGVVQLVAGVGDALRDHFLYPLNRPGGDDQRAPAVQRGVVGFDQCHQFGQLPADGG